MDAPIGPRWLYLHGFASGPGSKKGVALEAHYARRAISLARLDLRLPSLEHLRFSAALRATMDAIGGPSDRALLFGSSLGGLTACRVAERDPRVFALVLLAPAFRLAERWRARIGEAAWAAWRADDAFAIDDHVTPRRTTVDFGFIEELVRLDVGWPDVRVPTLIVHGRRDDVVGIDLSRSFSAQRPWVRLVEVDDGHELTDSLPRIAEEADRFLAPLLR